MIKILPINEKPMLWTYTHHGYFHSIVSAEDKVNYDTNEPVAKVSVKDYYLKKWNVQNGQMRYEIDADGNLNAYTNQWNLGMDLAFWRECQENDEIEMIIHKQLFSNVRSSITLFITNSNQEDMLSLESYDIKLGNSSRDGIYYSTGGIVETNEYIYENPVKPIKLRLVKEGINISIEYCDNKMQSEKAIIKELEKDSESLMIGFAINLGNSSYYEWTFSNYIQLYCNSAKLMRLEYMWNIHQNWISYTTNYFFDYQIIKEREVQESKYSVMQFIERQINMNRYIETEINDKLHSKDREKEEPFYHRDLIYGYDHKKELLYMLFYENGMPKTTIMPYSSFLSSSNFLQNRVFFIMDYNPGIEDYVLSRKHILQLLKEYRDCTNISYYESEFENVDGYKMGMNCLRYFCTPNGMKLIIYDVRISHLFYEHSLCNKNRIQYLIARGILRELECVEILELLDEEIKNLQVIRSQAIKVILGKKVTIEMISERMQRILVLEEKITNMLIQLLES